MASPASVIVGRAKPGNRHAKAGCGFQELCPVVLQLPVSRRVPDFDRVGDLEQVIDVPVRFGHTRQMMTEAGAEAAGAKGAPHVAIEPRDKVELPQAANPTAPHLRNIGDQDVGAFGFRQFCAGLILACLHRWQESEFGPLQPHNQSKPLAPLL